MTMLCPYCKADPDGDLDAALRALQSCINCRTDVQARGGWTGAGWAALARLTEIYGRDAVTSADARVHDEVVAALDAERAGQYATIGESDTRHIMANRKRTLCGRTGYFHHALFEGGGSDLCRTCARRASALSPDVGQMAWVVTP